MKNKLLKTLMLFVVLANMFLLSVFATEVTIPSGLGKNHSYMGWQMITSPSSPQMQLINTVFPNGLDDSSFDDEGFGKINGRYAIACTYTFGNVGDYIDWYKEDGTIIKSIVCDIKNQNDSGCNEWGHLSGAVIVEFVVDKRSWYPESGNGYHVNPGTASCHPEWGGIPIVKAVNHGSYYDNPDFEGGSETDTKTEEETSEDMSMIIDEWDLAGMPAKSKLMENATKIELPKAETLTSSESKSLESIKLNLDASKLQIIDYINVVIVFIGVLISFYSMLIMSCYFLDQFNSIIEISTLEIATFGLLSFAYTKEDAMQKGYLDLGGMFKIVLGLNALSMVLISGVCFKLVYYIYDVVVNVVS